MVSSRAQKVRMVFGNVVKRIKASKRIVLESGSEMKSGQTNFFVEILTKTLI